MEKSKFEVQDLADRGDSYWGWPVYFGWKTLIYGNILYKILALLFSAIGFAGTFHGSGIFTTFFLIFLYFFGMVGFASIVDPEKNAQTGHWVVTTSFAGYLWGFVAYIFYALYIFQY